MKNIDYKNEINSINKNSKSVKDKAIIYLDSQKNKMSLKDFNKFSSKIVNYLKNNNLEEKELSDILALEQNKIIIDSIVEKNKLKFDILKNSLDSLQKDKDENTWIVNLWIDKIVWAFWWNTWKENYEIAANSIKNNLDDYIKQLEKDLSNIKIYFEKSPVLSDNNIILELEKMLSDLKNLKNFNLDTKYLKSTFNSIKYAPKAAVWAYHWAKWVVKWTVETTWWAITWAVELTKIIFKYWASFFTWNEEYREEISEQIAETWEVLKEFDKDLVLKIIKNEIDRISSLPSEKQSEEIWKFAWNIIWILVSIKWIPKTAKIPKKFLSFTKSPIKSSKSWLNILKNTWKNSILKWKNLLKNKIWILKSPKKIWKNSLNSLKKLKTNVSTITWLKNLAWKSIKSLAKISWIALVLWTTWALVYAEKLENGEINLYNENLEIIENQDFLEETISNSENNFSDLENWENLSEENILTDEENWKTENEENLENFAKTFEIDNSNFSNLDYLKAIIWDNFQNIENPNFSEIQNILENNSLMLEKWIIFNYALQSALNILWFWEILWKVDGFLWKKTKNAILAFQKKYNLKQDSIAWKETIWKILELLKKDNF